MNQDDVTPDVVERSVRRPGHELGAARGRAGISLEDMAATLHLPADQVRALEADDYSRLPPPAYVRGYLRAYAREVGMDADQLVADYDVVCGEVEDPELVIHPGVPDPATGHGPVLALLLVLAVAVAGALAWWLQQSTGISISTGNEEITEPTTGAAETGSPQNDPADDGGEPEQTEPTEPEPTVPEAPEPATGEAGADPAESTATMAGTDETIEGADAADGNTAAVDDAAGDSELDSAGTTSSGETSDGNTATADAEEALGQSMLAEGDGPRATNRADEVATAAASEGPDQLRIEVDGESWLEVFDVRGRQLAYTLYSGGEPVILNGWAPFDVFLGNSPDVTLRFGDREIDHSAFVRSDNTARFLVDAEGARRR